MLKTKYVLLTAGSVAALYGVSYLVKLNRLSNEIETVTNVSIFNISLSGIDLKVEVKLKNPSGGSVKVKQPFVKMIYDTTTVATSQVVDQNITVPKFSEVSLEPVMINMGFVNLALTVPALLKEYRSSGKLNLIVKTISTINDKFPYTKTDVISLGRGKQG